MSWFKVQQDMALGVQITDENVRLVLLRREKGQFLIVGRHSQTLTPGLVHNGIVQERDLLAEKISESLARLDLTNWHGLPAVLVLPERQAYSHVFNLPPDLTPQQIEGALALEAESVLPIALSETYSAFKAVGKQSYLFAAVPRKVVDVYLEVLRLAELKPVAFDLESLGQGRALLAEGSSLSGKASLVINIGEKHTVISAFTPAGYLYTSLVVMLGCRDFDQEAAHFWQIETEEAEKRLSKGENVADKEKLLAKFQPLLSQLQGEIAKASQYYTEGNPGQKIEQVLFCGLSSQLTLLLPSLADRLRLPFQSCCPPWAKSGFANSAEECSVYTTVLGAARLAFLPYEELLGEINLLPQRYKQSLMQAGTRSLVSLLQLVVGVFLATMVVVFVVVWSTLHIEANSLHNNNVTTANILRGKRFEEINELVNAFNKEVRLAFLANREETLTSSRVSNILTTLPGGVSLRQITWSAEEGVVSLQGKADTRDNYLAFRELLEKKPYIGAVEVPLSNIARREQVDFTLRFPLQAVKTGEK